MKKLFYREFTAIVHRSGWYSLRKPANDGLSFTRLWRKDTIFYILFFYQQKEYCYSFKYWSVTTSIYLSLKSRDGPVINTKLNVSFYFKESILRIHVHTIFLWSVKVENCKRSSCLTIRYNKREQQKKPWKKFGTHWEFCFPWNCCYMLHLLLWCLSFSTVD